MASIINLLVKSFSSSTVEEKDDADEVFDKIHKIIMKKDKEEKEIEVEIEELKLPPPEIDVLNSKLYCRNIDIDFKPEIRSGHSTLVVQHLDKLYLFGGYIKISENDFEVGSCYGELWEMDLISYEWKMLGGESEEKPAPRCSSSINYIGFVEVEKDVFSECLLVFGGSGADFGEEIYNDCWLFDLKFGYWRKVEAQNPPPHVYGHITTKLYLNDDDKQFLVWGGTNGMIFFDKIYIFEYETCCRGRWRIQDHLTLPTPLPQTRYKHCVVRIDDILYILGGSNLSIRNMQGFENRKFDIWKLNVRDFSWQELKCSESSPFIPVGRFGHSIEILQDKLILFSGRDKAETSLDKLDNVYSFDFVTLEWKIEEIFGDHLCSRDFHSSFIHKCMDQEYLYIWGGTRNGEGKKQIRQNDLNRLQFNRFNPLNLRELCSIAIKKNILNGEYVVGEEEEEDDDDEYDCKEEEIDKGIKKMKIVESKENMLTKGQRKNLKRRERKERRREKKEEEVLWKEMEMEKEKAKELKKLAKSYKGPEYFKEQGVRRNESGRDETVIVKEFIEAILPVSLNHLSYGVTHIHPLSLKMPIENPL